MAKKKNSRKALAVALGIMGIAGLSLASASTLTINPSSEIAMGTSTAFTSCDDTVGITYGYNATTYVINSVTVTGIADLCANKAMSFSIAVASGPIVGSVAANTVFTTTAANNNSYTVSVTTPAIPLTADLGTATVIIG